MDMIILAGGAFARVPVTVVLISPQLCVYYLPQFWAFEIRGRCPNHPNWSLFRLLRRGFYPYTVSTVVNTVILRALDRVRAGALGLLNSSTA